MTDYKYKLPSMADVVGIDQATELNLLKIEKAFIEKALSLPVQERKIFVEGVRNKVNEATGYDNT